MRFLPNQIENRRDFLRSAGRYGLAALLLVLGEELGRRGGKRQECVNQMSCSGCAVFPGCELPQALSAKQAVTGGGK